ncbi:MAG: hypothetical protein AAF499_05465, partial [Pseudomonadota bacterium]
MQPIQFGAVASNVDPRQPDQGGWLTSCALAIVFGLLFFFTRGHAPADYDAVNFLLALRDFDVAQHQPHPPGAPLFIAMGKVLVWLGVDPLTA